MALLNWNIYQFYECLGMDCTKVRDTLTTLAIIQSGNLTFTDPLLNTRLAFTSPTISGTYWMRLNVNEKPIKFQLIDRNPDKSLLVVSIQTQLSESKLTLNETLIRKGLAKVELIDNQGLTNIQAKILNNLKSCQAKAHKEGVGVWSEGHHETLLEASKRFIKRIFSKLARK